MRIGSCRVDCARIHLPPTTALPASLHMQRAIAPRHAREFHRVLGRVMRRHLEHVDKPALRAPHVEDCASGRLHGSQKWKFDLIVVKTGRQRRREPLRVVVATRVVVAHPPTGARISAIVVAHRPIRRVITRPRCAAAAVAIGIRVVCVPHRAVILAGRARREVVGRVALAQVNVHRPRLAHTREVLVPMLHAILPAATCAARDAILNVPIRVARTCHAREGATRPLGAT
mmetsp:Transcript_7554/g.16908  ORF Transcript_7554/g.16908 Transcript_7554/m.16908 type:complete len:230 (+) Transcript_7554:1127-1816(+)